MDTKDLRGRYDKLRSSFDFESATPTRAFAALTELIELASLLNDQGRTTDAIHIAEAIGCRQLTSRQRAMLHYFTSVAWGDLYDAAAKEWTIEELWAWHQRELDQQIYHLRKAQREPGFARLPPVRKAQVFSNLANMMNTIGRPIEAIALYDLALAEKPRFGMAFGNKAIALTSYARGHYDEGHTLVLIREARRLLIRALRYKIDFRAERGFRGWLTEIDSHFSRAALRDRPEDQDFPLGTSDEEEGYRRWSLQNRLFLNPLNDVRDWTVAATDVLSTPSMVVGLGEGPNYQGLFNQLKQEFVSARFMLFEGVSSDELHFSDRETHLVNTLDYPAYCLAVERVKAAYRIAYSLFDKIAFFLNDYLQLGISERKIAFRSVWYEKGNTKRPPNPTIMQSPNWTLRGLFYVARDLYHYGDGFTSSEPDADELAQIRHHMEHKYLKVHDELWSSPSYPGGMRDSLAHSINRTNLCEKTLKIFHLTRAALIYLSFAIHAEERRRTMERDPDALVPPIVLGTIEDEWKR